MSEPEEKQVENEDSNENSNEEKKKQTNKLVSLIKKLPLEIYIAIFFFILTALFMLTPVYRQLELTSYDLRFQLKKKVKQSKKVTVVKIDDAAIKNIAKWVWRRNLHAQGVKIMQELGARQILFDIEFTEQSARAVTKQDRKNFPILVRSKLDLLKNEIGNLKRDVLKGNLVNLSLKLGTFENSIEKRKKDILRTITSLGQDDDLIFALAMKQFGKVIIPIRGDNSTLTDKIEPVSLEYVYNNYGLKYSGKRNLNKIREFKKLIVPVNPLHRAPYRLGFTNADLDEDGVMRRIRLFSRYRKMLFPQLAVASLFDLLDITAKNIDINPGASVVLKNALLPGRKKRRNIKIPTDSNGMMMINWTGNWSRSFSKISFYNLFDYWKSKENYLKVLADLDKNIFNGQGNIAHRIIRFQEMAALEKGGNLLTQDQQIEKLAIETYITNIGVQELDALLKTIEQRKAEIKTKKGALKKAYQKQLDMLSQSSKNILSVKNHYDGLIKKLKKYVKGKVCIVGLTASATHDFAPTPADNRMPLVYLHANLLNTILQEDFITRVPWWMTLLFMLIVTLFIGYYSKKLPAAKMAILGSGVILAVITINFILFSFGSWFDLVAPFTAAFLTFLFVVILHYYTESKAKKDTYDAFKHYIAPEWVDLVVKDRGKLALGGERKVLTAFFSDIEAFSSMSEKMSPDELVVLLNEYLTTMTDIVMGAKGTVDKFEGDAILAFYGAPIPFDDHAERACLAAVEMQKQLDIMRPYWKERFGHEIFVRMGINTGAMVVGNMGSKTRFDYTIMGDAVNLASRLEGANKFYGTYTMASGKTYEKAKHLVEGRELDCLKVKGKNEPVTVYELLGKKGELNEKTKKKLALYQTALAEYKARDWTKARDSFKNLLKIDSNDGPSLTYIERCKIFIKKPPSDNWDGVFTLKSK